MSARHAAYLENLRRAHATWLPLEPLCAPGPLIVGEAPNRSGAGRHRSEVFMGGRLATFDGGRLERTNLLWEWPGQLGTRGSHFPRAEGRRAAYQLLLGLEAVGRPRRPLILVGTRVAEAFGLKRSEYDLLTWHHIYLEPDHDEERVRADHDDPRRAHDVAVMPHTSGLVHWWNDPANVRKADRFFRKVLADMSRTAIEADRG